jgi:hypothetical protein
MIMKHRAETQLSSERESGTSDHRDDEKPPNSGSKEGAIVAAIGAQTPPPDGGTRAWLVLAGVSLSVAHIYKRT